MATSGLHDQPYVMSSFLAGFPELVVSRGGGTLEICKRADLAPEAVLEGNHLLPFDQFNRLLESSAKMLDSPDFALQLASGQDLRPIGPIARMLDPTQTVEEALETITEQLSLVASGIGISLKKHAHIVTILFDVSIPELEYRRQFQDYLLASTVTIIRQLTRGPFPLRGVFFTRTPEAAEDLVTYDRFFRCPIAFGASNLKLTYDSRILSGDIAVDSPAWPDVLERESTALQQRVTDALALAITSGKTDLEDVAESLGCSSRTLRRRLAAQGASFSALRDNLRYALAKEYLQISHYSLANIAVLLGYTNQSAFTRSFLRWSGVTPSTYRRKNSSRR